MSDIHRIERPSREERLDAWLKPIIDAAKAYVESKTDGQHIDAHTYEVKESGKFIHGDKCWHALQVLNLADNITEHKKLNHLQMTAINVGDLVCHAYLSEIPSLIEAAKKDQHQNRISKIKANAKETTKERKVLMQKAINNVITHPDHRLLTLKEIRKMASEFIINERNRNQLPTTGYSVSSFESHKIKPQ